MYERLYHVSWPRRLLLRSTRLIIAIILLAVILVQTNHLQMSIYNNPMGHLSYLNFCFPRFELQSSSLLVAFNERGGCGCGPLPWTFEVSVQFGELREQVTIVLPADWDKPKR